MSWFGRDRNSREAETTRGQPRDDTFASATGGGWDEPPMRVAIDGGSQADYVGQQLERARAYAKEHVAVGEKFDFTLTNIPRDIASPHEIIFGLMMRAENYGLQYEYIVNETARLIRTAA